MRVRFEQVEGDGVLFGVDLGIYSSTALQKVVHRFTDRCYIHLAQSEGIAEVRMRAKGDADILSISGDFCNELLDQTLRETLAIESRAERDLILAHALSRTSFIVPSVKESDSGGDVVHARANDRFKPCVCGS